MAEPDAIQHVGVRGRHRRGRGHDVQRPARFGCRRHVAHRFVACLIAETRRHDNLAWLEVARQDETDADREVLFEHCQRLRLSDLFQVSRCRVHNFSDRDACRRLDCQHRGDEQRIARFVRLDVEARGKVHLQRGPQRGTRVDVLALDDGRDLGLDAAQLRLANVDRRREHTDDEQTDARSAHATSLPSMESSPLSLFDDNHATVDRQGGGVHQKPII